MAKKIPGSNGSSEPKLEEIKTGSGGGGADPEEIKTGGGGGGADPGTGGDRGDGGRTGQESALELERDHPDQTAFPGMTPAKPKRKYTKRTDKKTDPAQSRADRALLAHAFEGTFQALGMALGPHWALNQAREVEGQKYPAEGEVMADAWQPVFDRYGGKITGEALMWVSASTVTVAILAPRIRESVKHEAGLIGWIKRKLAARRARRAA